MSAYSPGTPVTFTLDGIPVTGTVEGFGYDITQRSESAYIRTDEGILAVLVPDLEAVAR